MQPLTASVTPSARSSTFEDGSSYVRTVAPWRDPLREQLGDLSTHPEQRHPAALIMSELPPDRYSETYVLRGGNFRVKGDRVEPGVLTAFSKSSHGRPINRFTFAKWLVSKENPLTARVAVNRSWSVLFGAGVVATEEDFGTQGESPTHPRLLDWLATEVVRNGWNMKTLNRTLVDSNTYRQSSDTSTELRKIDPENRLYARGARFRMEAEMVRDQALAIGGLLSRKLDGPSVFPSQPPGFWNSNERSKVGEWKTSRTEDHYRRGLYTFCRRSVPYPALTIFDATSRKSCTIRRIRTNTPLQALVLLNDPAYVEAAQGLARRMMLEGGKTPESRACHGLSLCLSRAPNPLQVAELLELYQDQTKTYRRYPHQARRMATDPIGPVPEGLNVKELAAWTVVKNVLLNMDAVLKKG